MTEVMEQTRDIRKLWSAFQSSRVLFTANNYRVFDYLEDRKSADEIAAELKTDNRATEILLDALAGMNLLRKIKNSYKNKPAASKLLVSGRPFYQGDIIKHAEALCDKWSDLDSILKSGEPSGKVRSHKNFILGMHNLSAFKAQWIVNEIDLENAEKAIDLGGGPGTYAIELAKRGLQVTLFDTHETIRIAKKVAGHFPGLKENIRFAAGDFITDEIGRDYDLVFMSHILHSYSESRNLDILKKCAASLKEKGRIVIQEFLISEDNTRPLNSALFAVNMLVNTSGGRTYSPGVMKKWLLEAGFGKVRKQVTADGVLVIAEKKHQRKER